MIDQIFVKNVGNVSFFEILITPFIIKETPTPHGFISKRFFDH